MSSRLRKYLEARERGGFGWGANYDSTVAPDGNYAYLAGHYAGLLDDVLRAIGARRFAALLDAHDAIDEHLKNPAPREG